MKIAARTGVAFVVLAVALPALNPFAGGPSAHGVPWLVGCLFFAVLCAALNGDWLRNAAFAWLFAALLSALMGLVQYFGLASSFAPWISPADAGEAYANLRQRNQFASLTNIGLASLLWWMADRGRPDAPPLRSVHRWLIGLAVALLATGHAATGSRIGLVQLVLVVVLAACWGAGFRPRRVGLGLAILAGYVLAAMALPRLLSAVTGVEGANVFARIAQTRGCESRRVLWSNVLDLIAQKPWTGWGWGELDYAHYATLYEGERFCDILDNAHNLPLHLAVELGLPFALFACAAAVWGVLRAAPWRAEKPLHRLAWTVLALIGLHSLVEYPLWYAPFFTAAALCIAYLWLDGRPLALATGARITALRVLSAMALVAITLHAWRDYHRVSQLYLPFAQRSTEMKQRSGQVLRDLVWFRDQAAFAQLTTTALTPANAADRAASARRLLHYSPEPRVIESLIESLVLIRQDDEAMWHLARYRAAFPADHAAWSARNRPPAGSARTAPVSTRPEAP